MRDFIGGIFNFIAKAQAVVAVTAVLLFGIIAVIFTVPAFLLTVGLFTAATALTGIAFKRYAIDLWIGFDKFCNAALGGRHTETVSSRLGKSTLYGGSTVLGLKFIDHAVAALLNIIDTDHCEKAMQDNI